MESTRLRACARVCVLFVSGLLLVACQPVREAPPAPDFADLMEQAAALAGAGQSEAALAVLDEAARADPTSSLPWMRKTQIHFHAENYGAAVVSAQEVLHRAPEDPVADSYLVVSSLRIAIGTLARIRETEHISGAARSEAEKLAATMRETLGQDILVPEAAQAARPQPARRPAVRPQAAPASTTPATPASSGTPSDPFSVLQGGN